MYCRISNIAASLQKPFPRPVHVHQKPAGFLAGIKAEQVFVW
jgi:hypothetical protein